MTGVKMADEKAQPTFVITAPQENQPKKSSRLTRKHILIAVVSLVITALVLVAVLVGIRIYSDHELESLKLQYSMTMKDKDNQNVNQNVSADATANIVQYDVQKDGVKATILQDFDKGIQISRVESDSGVACYLTALNRSNAQEPTKLPTTAPTPGDNTQTRQLVYKVDNKPINDLSFLGKRASTLCANVPTHWMVPSCDGDETGLKNSTSADATHSVQKRATVCATCGGYYCVCGCCNAICGSFASSSYTWYYSNGVYYCTYYMYYVSCRVYLKAYPYSGCNLNGRNYYYPWS
jgi:ABC-type maltose transport system permease subunit